MQPGGVHESPVRGQEGLNGRGWSPGFEERLEGRNRVGSSLNRFVEIEIRRVADDEAMPPQKKVALLQALDMMVSNGRTERLYGLQVYMHLTGQELPPTKSARTMQAKRKLDAEAKSDSKRAATNGSRF